MTNAEPEIVTLAEQPYVAITADVTMERIGTDLPPLIGEVFGWLAGRGAAPAGAPFWKYNVIDMDASLEIEVAIPVAQAVPGDGRVIAGMLPAGRYVTVRHVGPPETLAAATADLLDWAVAHGLKLDSDDDGRRWGARLERYLTDPATEPDTARWVTELAIRLAD